MPLDTISFFYILSWCYKLRYFSVIKKDFETFIDSFFIKQFKKLKCTLSMKTSCIYYTRECKKTCSIYKKIYLIKKCMSKNIYLKLKIFTKLCMYILQYLFFSTSYTFYFHKILIIIKYNQKQKSKYASNISFCNLVYFRY